jgi:hypothetical protein
VEGDTAFEGFGAVVEEVSEPALLFLKKRSKKLSIIRGWR